MPHSSNDGPANKRQRLNTSISAPSYAGQSSIIFSPFRVVGLVSPTGVPFTSVPLGKTTFQITTSVGRALQTYDLRRGLNLVFVTRPQTPANITATLAWKHKVYAAWGNPREGNASSQGIWVFQRGRKISELQLPGDLEQPITQILSFGQWLVGCALTRVEIWNSDTLEHYTTIHTMASRKGDNELTGGITTMPTFLNKIFLGRKDGWVEIWNVSTGKLVYTVVPPSSGYGAVTCMEPSPALSMMAVAYAEGPLIIHNILTDKMVLQVDAGSSGAPVTSISFRTDGAGAGQDGRKDGVMATATTATGDVTFWDLNGGGRVMGVLRSAHNPPSRDHAAACGGGVSKAEFLSGQSIIITSGRDNSLKSWIFDQSPFSPVPRTLHTRSGHADTVTCLQFLPSDFDGADAGNKWLLSGGRDRSLWGWSLRRDGQSSELSQGNIRKKAKKYGLLATNVLDRGPSTTLEDIKAPAITCIASSLNRDGGIGALPGKQPIWQKRQDGKTISNAELSGMTGWESVVTAHENDQFARTWFWGRKRAGRWALPTGDNTNVSTVAMTACGNFALVGSVGGSLDMYNLQSGRHRQRFPTRLTPAQARQLKMQQLKQVDAVAQLQIQSGAVFAPGIGKHTGAVTGIAVDLMNKSVVSCGLDGKVKFWDFITGNLTQQLDWSTPIRGCRYHDTNDLMAFSCDDRSIRVADIETRKTIREFHRFSGSITDFCFSNDGRWIIAATQEDRMIRIFDLPTSHLIDVIRLQRPCVALAMATTGEYLATVIEGELGVGVWTNKTLFRTVPTKRISDASVLEAAGPTASGEGGQGFVAASAEDAAVDNVDNEIMAPAIEQLSADMMTLSVIPKNRWQTLIHLDLIKQRNKPKEPIKAPEQAPFFLPSLPGQNMGKTGAGTNDQEPESRITKLDRSRSQETFTKLLRSGATSNNYSAFIEHLKSLSPSSIDLELRSLSPGDSADDINELFHFVRALTGRLVARRDYELTQAWMTVFLRLHSEMVLESEPLLEALKEWKVHQETASARLDELVGYCSGVIGFLRSPRT